MKKESLVYVDDQTDDSHSQYFPIGGEMMKVSNSRWSGQVYQMEYPGVQMSKNLEN